MDNEERARIRREIKERELQIWRERWREETRTFQEWQFCWWQNEIRERKQLTARSLLHYLPDVARYPFQFLNSSDRPPDSLSEEGFWKLVYHCLATTFVAKLAIQVRDYVAKHSGIVERTWAETWEKIGEDAQKALIALGSQGFWGFMGWRGYFKHFSRRRVIVQPVLDNVLKEMVEAVIWYWADGRMWYRRRKPGKDVAFNMVKTAFTLRSQLLGEEPDKVLYRACINSGNLQLVRQPPTEVGLQVCVHALESVVCCIGMGHGYGLFVDDDSLEEPLKFAILEMGIALGKTTEELKELVTYHGPVYRDFT